MNPFEQLCLDLEALLRIWEPRLLALSEKQIAEKRNSQQRNIRQILGHMADSATNNTHRIIHLHYQPSPLRFPDYAHFGNNDRWIAIQHYEQEDWIQLVHYWKYLNLHLIHLVRNADLNKLSEIWISATGEKISMEEMIRDYPRHFILHLNEIEDLLH